MAGEENRDKLTEPGIQGMRDGMIAVPSSRRMMGHAVKLVRGVHFLKFVV